MVNEPGEENCFLNTALQALWHLTSFRSAILDWSASCEVLCSCLVCGVKHVFDEFTTLQEWGELASGQMIREELARVYDDKGQFQLNQASDTVEALHALLAAIHSKALGDVSQGRDQESSGGICRPLCPAHAHFGLVVAEVKECDCGKGHLSRWDFSTFTLPIYVAELLLPSFGGDVDELCSMPEHSLLTHKGLSTVLPMTNRLSEELSHLLSPKPATCEHCQGQAQVRLEVGSAPQVISLSLVWPEENPSSLEVLQVLAAFPDYLNVQAINPSAVASCHSLLGLLMYSGSHYLALFRGESSGAWYRIDDSIVRKVESGTRFEMLLDCLQSRMYPVAVFYEADRAQLEIEQELCVKDWLEMERWARALDKYRKGVELEFAVPKSAQVQRLQFVQDFADIEVEGVQRSLDPVDWKCVCGKSNPEVSVACYSCLEIKAGSQGWKCPTCTLINTATDNCEVCGSSKPQLPQSPAVIDQEGQIYSYHTPTSCCCVDDRQHVCGAQGPSMEVTPIMVEAEALEQARDRMADSSCE
jgi:hypothetical protein